MRHAFGFHETDAAACAGRTLCRWSFQPEQPGIHASDPAGCGRGAIPCHSGRESRISFPFGRLCPHERHSKSDGDSAGTAWRHRHSRPGYPDSHLSGDGALWHLLGSCEGKDAVYSRGTGNRYVQLSAVCANEQSGMGTGIPLSGRSGRGNVGCVHRPVFPLLSRPGRSPRHEQHFVCGGPGAAHRYERRRLSCESMGLAAGFYFAGAWGLVAAVLVGYWKKTEQWARPCLADVEKNT